MKLLSRKRALVISGDPLIPTEFHALLCPQSDSVISAECEIFSEILDGLELESAGHGPEGWTRVQESLRRKSPFSLAIVEQRLPGEWDGAETVLRLWSEDPLLPILIYDTAGFTEASRREILCRLAHPERFIFLDDPLDADRLRQLAAIVISRRRSQAESDERITRLHCEVDRARLEAMEAIQSKSELFDNISHELRTPMNAILGFSGLLLAEPLSADQLEKLQYVHQAGTTLMGVIDKMLDFAKLSSGRIRLTKTPFELEEVMREVVSALSPQATRKGLHIEQQMASRVPRWVRADRHRFQQILLNLAENAVKFTEQGSIHIQTTLDEETDVTALLRITVTDSGVGIPADRQEAMFQSFMQADGSLSRRYGGLGLGLAIGKQLADLMGGQLGFRSTPGQGSCFWLCIGLTKCRPGEHDHLSKPRIAEGREPCLNVSRRNSRGKPRVLVAETNYLNRTSAEMLLSRAGCLIDPADNCQEVLAMIEKNHYDLVFLDVDMAGLNVAETVGRLRTLQDKSDSRTPLIAMTEQTSPDDRQRWLKAGVDDCFVKPCAPEAIIDSVCRYLPQCSQSLGRTGESDSNIGVGSAEYPQERIRNYFDEMCHGMAGKDFLQMETAAAAIKDLLRTTDNRSAADEAMRVQLASRSRDFQKVVLSVERLRKALALNGDHDAQPESEPVFGAR